MNADKPDLTKATPRPWRACKEGNCSCGQIWSVLPDVPVAIVTIGKWGDPVPVMRKIAGSRRKEPAIELIAYGEVTEEAGKANAALIVEAVNAWDRHLALIATLTEALEQMQACIDFSPTGKWKAANDKATAALKLAKESGNG